MRSVWQNYAVDASVFPSLQDAEHEDMASEEHGACWVWRFANIAVSGAGRRGARSATSPPSNIP